MLSPLRDEFLLRFLFWEDICLYSLGLVYVFVRDVPWEVVEINIWIFIRVVPNFALLMSLRGLRPLEDHHCAPYGQIQENLICKKKTKKTTNPITFTNRSFINTEHIPVTHTHKKMFWFQMVSSGSLKMITLFVRKTKYSYAILNLLCLGCSRFAVPK